MVDLCIHETIGQFLLKPIPIQELAADKNDPDPKALACYGMLSATSGCMHLRFVSGRPVSQVTTDFLEWLYEQVQAQGKQVLVLIGIMRPGMSVNRSKPGCANTIKPCNTRLKQGMWACVSSCVDCPPRVPGSIESSQSGSTASVRLSNQLGF
jgi:hypothetical protein